MIYILEIKLLLKISEIAIKLYDFCNILEIF